MLKWIVPTVEGAPIRYYLRSRASQHDLLLIEDTTADRLGAQAWYARGCLELPGARLAPQACTEEVKVNERTPPELIDRRTLPSCGRVGPRASRGLVREAFECLRSSSDTSRGAELLHIEASEEHPRVRYLRVVEDRVEVFENSGGYAPTDDRWSHYGCRELSAGRTEPRGCGEPRSLR